MKLSPKTRRADDAIIVYAKLNAIERKARRENLNPQQIVDLRQNNPISLLEKYKEWLNKKHLLVVPITPIAKAINYTLRHGEGLIRYLMDGRTFIDNNHTEREIKPFVIA